MLLGHKDLLFIVIIEFEFERILRKILEKVIVCTCMDHSKGVYTNGQWEPSRHY